ncbi:MAG: nitrite reductase/ring-hydroxylating ferredoxin subunit [Pseudohongiellaceae bacterium]
MAFYALERLTNLYDGYCRSYQIVGRPLLLVQQNGQRYLLLNQCPHRQMPLTRATLSGDFIRCPSHGLRFNLITGATADGCANRLQFFRLCYDGVTVGVNL